MALSTRCCVVRFGREPLTVAASSHTAHLARRHCDARACGAIAEGSWYASAAGSARRKRQYVVDVILVVCVSPGARSRAVLSKMTVEQACSTLDRRRLPPGHARRCVIPIPLVRNSPSIDSVNMSSTPSARQSPQAFQTRAVLGRGLRALRSVPRIAAVPLTLSAPVPFGLGMLPCMLSCGRPVLAEPTNGRRCRVEERALRACPLGLLLRQLPGCSRRCAS